MLTISALILSAMSLYPLNPVEQDTLSDRNVHFTAGFNGPNGVFGVSPEVTVKYEMLVFHPLVVRTAFEVRYGEVTSKIYPDGDLFAGTFATELFYYKGNNKLTGYIGVGAVFTDYHFKMSDQSSDSLQQNLGVTNVRMKNTFGYRITLGLRYHQSYSLEVGVTEQRPLFSFTTRLQEDSYAEFTKKIRMSDVRVTFGYLFPFSLF